MSKFKNVLALLLVLILAVVMNVPSAMAQARYGIRSTGVLTSKNNLVLPADTWVYGWSIWPSSANSYAALYNAAALDTDAAEPEAIVDEVGEATQYDTKTVWFPKPILFTNGVSVRVVTGTAIVFYGPPPG